MHSLLGSHQFQATRLARSTPTEMDFNVDTGPTKGNAGVTLLLLCEMFGITVKLIYDRAPGQVDPDPKFQRLMRKFHIISHQNEPYNQKHNQAEDYIW